MLAGIFAARLFGATVILSVSLPADDSFMRCQNDPSVAVCSVPGDANARTSGRTYAARLRGHNDAEHARSLGFRQSFFRAVDWLRGDLEAFGARSNRRAFIEAVKGAAAVRPA
jgi:hypothetical protein